MPVSMSVPVPVPMPNPMTADEFRHAVAAGGCTDLSGRTKLQLRGADRVRYLNGQVTNDVAQIAAGETIYACVTDRKGRLEADAYITAGPGDSLLLDAPGELRESLLARLDRYIIADDVELADVTDDWKLIHCLGPASAGDGGPESLRRACNRFGVPGADLWFPAGAAPASGAPALSPDVLERLRIENRIPAWGAELGPGVLPPEARLETRAISFEKGCYIGQEVISRIRSVGRVNRTLERVVQAGAGAAPLESGCALTSGSGEPAGMLTSVCPGPEPGKRIGLAYVKRGFSAPGTLLDVRDPENKLVSRVEIRDAADLSHS